jgi:hypothetical protein
MKKTLGNLTIVLFCMMHVASITYARPRYRNAPSRYSRVPQYQSLPGFLKNTTLGFFFDNDDNIKAVAPLSYEGRSLGFFNAWGKKPHYFWYDTRLVFNGFGGGYRRLLEQQWFSQNWFGGVYVYYFPWYGWRMPGKISKLRKLLIGIQEEKHIDAWPDSLNVGLELAASDWGQVTVDLHRFFHKQEYGGLMYHIKDKGAISIKASIRMSRSITPFVSGSLSWKENIEILKPMLRLPEHVTFRIGFRCVLDWLETEWQWDVDKEVSYLNLRFRLDGIDCRNAYFQHRLYKIPERTIPPRYFQTIYYGEPPPPYAEVVHDITVQQEGTTVGSARPHIARYQPHIARRERHRLNVRA